MSETDSDNDYASADEETEESVSKSDDIIPIVDLAADAKSKLNSEDNLIAETIKVPTENKNSAKPLSEPKMPPKNELEMPLENEPKLPLENEPKLPVENEPKLPLENEPKLPLENEPKLPLENEPKLPLENEPKLPLENEPEISPKNDSEKIIPESNTQRSNLMRTSSDLLKTKQTVNPSVNAQPKRVTLRLEKKLQERNQVPPPCDGKKEEPKVEEKTSASWGFSSWGSSLLSTAASSVTTFTSQVSQGLGTVLETVETTLGAPPPEDLAAILKEKRDRELLEKEDSWENEGNEGDNTSEIPSFDESKNPEFLEEKGDSSVPATSALFTGMTSLTKVVGNTGSKVIMGGLDTLEMIGKKTIDILTEGDPGLRKKRSAFSGGITLSQVLREAKDKAESEQANASLEDQEETVHYSQMFDDYKGLVHLEALEMLSDQCQSKVQRALMLSTGESEEKDVIERISRICEDLPSADETPDEEVHQDFSAAILEHLNALQLKINLDRVKKARDSVNDWLNDCLAEQEKGHGKDSKEIYRQAIGSLAIFTASCVEHFHKFGELIMVQTDADFDVIMCATHLTGLTTVLCTEITIFATKFCQCLNTAADDSEDPDSITPLITNVYLEASNSTTYVQDAFQLLVPVLQTSSL